MLKHRLRSRLAGYAATSIIIVIIIIIIIIIILLSIIMSSSSSIGGGGQFSFKDFSNIFWSFLLNEAFPYLNVCVWDSVHRPKDF